MLKDGARSVGGQGGGRFSAVLVVFQFALTLVLLTGAGVFVRSLMMHFQANRAVPSQHLLAARIEFPEDRYKDADARQRFYDQLLPRLETLPGVAHVALTSSLPGLWAGSREFEMEGSRLDSRATRPEVVPVAVSPGYFATIHLPILQGRGFNQVDGAAGHRVAIVTRDMAGRLWPNQSPIGKRFRIYDDKKPGDWMTVVGYLCRSVAGPERESPEAAAL